MTDRIRVAEPPGRVPPPGPPPIFVVGVARSGTTLLSAMLSAHPRLDCGPESRFFARLRHLDAAQRGHLVEASTWPEPAIEFITSLENQGYPIVDLFGLTLEDVRAWLAARPPSLTTMLEALVAQHAQRRGKARWVEKTPRHLLMLDELRRLWPEAFIVRIVRDPRDVALSLTSMPFAGDSLVGNLVRIDQDDRASRSFMARDRRAFTLRYEDLVAHPERELRRVCTFLGEVYDPAVLDPGVTAQAVAGEHEWWKRSVGGPLDTSRVGRWRTEMPADVQHFASLHLARYLREHGYEGWHRAAGRVAIVPVADALGVRHEATLLELAQHDLVVVRPAPRRLASLRRQEHLVFFGGRGQLDPLAAVDRGIRGRLRFALSRAGLGAVLAVRRMRGRPALWSRGHTSRPRRPRDPGEVWVALLLRLLARSVEPAGLAGLLVSARRTRPDDGPGPPRGPEAPGARAALTR